MEFSAEVADSIAYAGDTIKLDDKTFDVILKELFLDLRRDDDEGEYSETPDVMGTLPAKISYSGLISLVTEGISRNVDHGVISGLLEELNWPQERIQTLLGLFEENKIPIKKSLLGVGSRFPTVVDVDWRLDYYLKNNFLERVDQPVYRISLKTETEDDVNFSCSAEQLQDLVAKLKDASKNIEKLSHF